MQILLSSLFIILNFYISGSFFANKNAHHNIICKFSLSSIMGAILISFISLLINFFSPINQLIGNIFLILSIIIFFLFFYFEKNRLKILICSFVTSILVTILILYSNIYRPDAGLYHLPYIQLIQENKILLGVTNINFRFGHSSILQYLSAIYNNGIMPLEVIILPPAILVSLFFVYFLSFYDKDYNFHEIKIFIFLIAIYSFYSFNRFSNFGNDAVSHLFFFLFWIRFIQIQFVEGEINEFGDLAILSIFAFLQKLFMIFLPLVCFAIFVKFFLKKNIFQNLKIIFSLIFLLAWLIKNILISGCVVYPVSFTCFKNLNVVDINSVREVAVASESWSKDWPNRNNNSLSMMEYNKNFNWLPSWINNHFKIVITKFTPFLITIFLVLTYTILFLKKNNSKIYNDEFIKKIKILVIISLLLTIFWFLKFPIYRYGQSFLTILFISLFTLIFSKFSDNLKLKKIFVYSSIIVLALAITKNFVRIKDNYKLKNKWPNIYTLSEKKEENFKKELQPVFLNGKLVYYFSGGSECMYNKSPCTNILVEKIIKKEKYGYEIFLRN